MNLRLASYLVLLAFSFLFKTTYATNYYWIGGAGSWSDINHWATASGGSVLQAVVPTQNDDVFFDAGSGFIAGSKIVGVNTNATCRNMTWSGALNNPEITGSSTFNLNVYGSITLQSGMVFSVYLVNLLSNSLGQTITSSGIDFGNGFMYIKGTGEYIFQDNFISPLRYVDHQSGIVNTNNQVLSVDGFSSSGSLTRTLTLGTSTITTNGVSGWNCLGTGLTTNANSSTIILNGSLNNTSFNSFSASSNHIYNKVIFTKPGNIGAGGGSAPTINSVLFLDDGDMGWTPFVVNSLTFTSGKAYTIRPNSTVTVAAVFNSNPGPCADWVTLTSSLPGSQGKISMPLTATVNVAYTTIEGINASGGAVFTASNSVNSGNNTGWTYTAPTTNTLYWIGGQGNWSNGAHWSTASGGVASGCIPGPATDVYIDINSGLTAGLETVTINTGAKCHNLTCSGSPTPAKLFKPSGSLGTLFIYGSVVLQSGMIHSIGTFFKSSNAETILSNGVEFTDLNSTTLRDAVFEGTGSWQFLDAFKTGRVLSFNNGSINTNNQAVSVYAFNVAGNYLGKNLTLGSSIINVTASGFTPCWDYINGTLNAGTSHIIFSPSISGVSPSSFYTYSGQTYYDVSCNEKAALGLSGTANFHNVLFLKDGVIRSSSNTFNKLTFSPNYSYILPSGFTQTVTGVFSSSVVACGGWISVSSSIIGFQSVISSPATATINVSNTLMQDIKAQGGASFNAISSVDNGNNTGWFFGAVTTNSLYWVGGSGNWTDATHWSSINNGIYPSTAPCVPGPGDDVFFNANSGLTAGSKSISISSGVYCHNITCAGSVIPPLFAGVPNVHALNIYGSTVLQSGGSYNIDVVFKSNSAETITSNSASFSYSGSSYSIVKFDGAGSWTLNDNFSTGNTIWFNQGTLNTNNKTVTCGSFMDAHYAYPITNVGIRQINLGTSTFSITSGSISWRYNQPNTNINAGTSRIICNTFANFETRTGQNYYDVTFQDNSSIIGIGSNFHNVIFLKGGTIFAAHIFNELTFNGGYTYTLESLLTQTITSNFYTSGNPCFISFIKSSAAASQAKINVQAGSTNYDYINVKDIDATPSYTVINVGGHSIDAGNNLNFLFAPTSTVSLIGLGPDITSCQSSLPLTLNTFSFYPNPVTTFTWSGGATTSSLSIATGGTYSVTVKYGATCTVTDNIVVTANPNPTLSISGGTVTCAGGSNTLTVAGANTYTWVSPSSNASSIIVNPSSNTTYSVVGTNTLGCVSATTIVQTVVANPTISIASVSNGGVICSGSSITITPSGASVYTLSPGSQTTTAAFTLNPTSTTVYNITGSNSGCVGNNANTTVTVNATPTVAIASVSSASICSGNSSTITASGANTYTLTSSTTTLTSSPFVVSPTSNTTYTITGTSVANCANNNILTQAITINTTPTVAIAIVSSSSICSGNSSTITASGANSYTLTSSTTTLTSNPFVVNPISNTTYTITGTSVANCASTNGLTQAITVSATPTITTSGATSATICSGQSYTMIPTGGTGNYTLTNTGATSTTQFVVNPTASITYTIIGANASGCISPASSDLNITLTVNATPTLAASSISSNTICSGQTITFTPTGGATTYTLVSSTYTDSTSPYTDAPSANTTYTLVGTGANGCLTTLAAQQYTASVTVNATPTLAASSISSNTICSGQTVTFTPTGGATTYTLVSSTYTDSTSPYTDAPSATTTYTLKGTGANGCITTLAAQQYTASVTVNATPTLAASSISSNTICSGQTVTFTPTGGATTYTLVSSTYTDSTSPYTDAPSTNTTYTLVGTGANGCLTTSAAQQYTASVTVNATPTLAASSISSNTICSGQTVTFTPTGGATTYTLVSSTYTDSTSPYTDAPSTTTTYTLNGTGANGCITALANQQYTASVTVNATPTITTSGATSATLCSGDSFTVIPTGSGTGSYTLAPSGAVTTTSFVVNPNATTTYSIIGANANGCISTTSSDLNVTLTVNATPTVNTLFSSNALCATQNVTITLSGANGIYTLTPSGATATAPSGSFVITPPAGTTVYQITANNTNGCISTLSQQIYTTTVSVVTNPTITALAMTNSICAGSTASITPFGATTFTVTNSANAITYTVASGQTFTDTPTVATTYTINGTATGGCVSIASTQLVTIIGINANPTITATSALSNTLCSGLSTTLTASGANTYSWSGGPTTPDYAISPSSTTVYTVTGTNALGCNNTSAPTTLTVTILNSPTLALATSINTNTLCSGNSATITLAGADAGSTYTLLPSILTSTTSFVINPIITTDYTVVATNANGCISTLSSQMYTTTVTVASSPTISVLAITPSATLCSGQSVTISPTGAVAGTYTLQNTNATVEPFVVTPNVTTTYTISGVGSNGCVSLASTDLVTTITVNQSPTLTASSQQDVLCFGDATGSVTLSTLGGTPTVSITPTTTNSLSAGSYTFVAIDPLGCSSAAVITINQPTAGVTVLAATETASNSNCVAYNGSANLTLAGGTPTYNVVWGNGATGTSPSNLNTGINTFTVTDSNGCTNAVNTGTMTIAGVTGITMATTSQSSVSCMSGTNGAVSFSTTGGGPDTYTLIGTSTTNTNTTGLFTALGADTYTAYVTGNGGCLATQLVSITQPTSSVSLMGNAVNSSSISCFGGNATITATAIGGAGNYIYTWGTNTSTVNTASYPAGTYTMTVVDGNNCGLASIQSFTVSQPSNSVSVSSIANNTIACFGSTTAVTAMATGGTGSLTYYWQAPSTSTTNVSTYTSGTYTMMVVDANGCASATQTITVVQPSTALAVTEVTLSASCANQNSGSVEIAITGGTAGYSVLWNTNSTALSLTNLPAGPLSAVVTDANGCVAFYNAIITTTTCISINIPSFFTPNGDGKNDLFVIDALSEYPNNKIEIYNRWGNLIYSKAPYDNTFNGKANVSNANGNGQLPSATYFIILDFGDGITEPYKGYVELKY